MKNRKTLPPTILVVIAGIAALLAFNAAMDYYRKAEKAAQDPDPYRIGRQVLRFRELCRAIPPDAVVGYVSNLPDEEFAGRIAFSGAQYAVAPRLLVPLDRYPGGGYVIGNYTVEAGPSGLIEQAVGKYGLELVKDYGAGVVLYRKP